MHARLITIFSYLLLSARRSGLFTERRTGAAKVHILLYCVVNPRFGVCVLHAPQETVLHNGDARSLCNEPPVYILTSTPTTVNRNSLAAKLPPSTLRMRKRTFTAHPVIDRCA